jgi:hypothetical protein
MRRPFARQRIRMRQPIHTGLSAGRPITRQLSHLALVIRITAAITATITAVITAATIVAEAGTIMAVMAVFTLMATGKD